MPLPQHVQYWLLQQGKSLAAEVTPTLHGRRAWVGVHPPRISRDSFLVRYFEVKREFIENDLDIHEEQLENKQTITVSGEEELVEVLSRWINNLNDLKGPSFSDYPI
jgi:hypothetical protein